MISSFVATIARVPVPLRSLAVCVACDERVELDASTCPSCGSHELLRLSDVLSGRVLNVTGVN